MTAAFVNLPVNRNVEAGMELCRAREARSGRGAGEVSPRFKSPDPGLVPTTELPRRDTGRAMSQENVEIVRRLYSLTPDAAGVVRGDYDNAFVDNFHPDVEIVPPSSYPDTPESGYRGPEGMLRWFQQLDEIWDDWRFEAERFLDGGDRVVAFVRVSGSAKQSGAALTISTAHVLTLRDGRVTRVDVFLDRPEALEAAGLPE